MDASFPYLCARDRVVLSATGMDGSLRGQILEYVFMYKYGVVFFLTIPFRSVRQARKHDTQRMRGMGRDTYVLARRCRCYQGCHFGQIHI